MQFERFIKAANWLAKSNTTMKILIGEPAKGEKVFLEYRKAKRSLHLVDEDNKEISRKVANKLFPYALAILTQVYESEYRRKYAPKKTGIEDQGTVRESANQALQAE